MSDDYAIEEIKKAFKEGAELRVEDVSKPTPEEEYLQGQLHLLQQSYMRDAQPLLERLHRLRCMRNPEWVMWMEQKNTTKSKDANT